MGTVADRIAELQSALATKQKTLDEIVASFEGDGSAERPFAVKPEVKQSFEATLAEAKEIQEAVKSLVAAKEIQDWSTAPATGSVAAKAAAADARDPEPVTQKTLGQLFVESPEFKALRGGAAGYTMATPFIVKGDLTGRYGAKDVYTDLPTGTPGRFGTIQRDTLVPRPQRRVRVRDLFPTQQTTAGVIEYFRVTGFTNAASTVAERSGTAFAPKPQSALTFVGEQAAVRMIAHWEAAHRNVLRDEPQLQGLIENELLYGLRLVEDDQILNGSGTGEDLLGIHNTPGIQTYAQGAVAGQTKADTIRRAITKALLSYYEPTGIVVHPNDWEDIELQKDTTGQYILVTAVSQGAEQRLWRLPVVDTPAQTEGQALVGAFGLGAQIYDREEANIRIAEQHADFFIRNAIAVLAEEALALAVKRPEAFVEVTYT